MFQDYLNKTLLPQFNEASQNICVETARRWLIYLNFSCLKATKGYYTDHHNRADVVNYRDNYFLPAMQSFESKMAMYSGIDMNEKIMPNLISNEKQVVLITHDETTIYSNNGQSLIWMENGKKNSIVN